MSAHAEASTGPLLWTAGALVAVSLAAAFSVRWGAIKGPPTAIETRAASGARALGVRDLVFLDGADGSVRIIDSHSGGVAGTVAPNAKSGFIRGVMRGMARERRSDGVGPTAPFRLTAWSDGGLTLDDSATGRHIELEAFGPSNRAAFAALLGPEARP